MRGRESRNNNGNDNNDDDNIAREQDSSGEGEEKYVRWILASRKPSNAISGFASFLNPWSGSLHPSIPITCPFLRIRITKGERNGINAPLPPFGLFASAVCAPQAFLGLLVPRATTLIPRFWTNRIQGWRKSDDWFTSRAGTSVLG